MNHSRVKHYVSIVGILALVIVGGVYLTLSPDPNATVILSIVAGIAGLGGYSLKQRQDVSNGGE